MRGHASGKPSLLLRLTGRWLKDAERQRPYQRRDQPVGPVHTGDSTRLRGSEGDAAGREPLLDQCGGCLAVAGECELVGLLRGGAERRARGVAELRVDEGRVPAAGCPARVRRSPGGSPRAPGSRSGRRSAPRCRAWPPSGRCRSGGCSAVHRCRRSRPSPSGTPPRRAPASRTAGRRPARRSRRGSRRRPRRSIRRRDWRRSPGPGSGARRGRTRGRSPRRPRRHRPRPCRAGSGTAWRSRSCCRRRTGRP